MTAPAQHTKPTTDTITAGPFARFVVLTLLAADGALSAVAAALFLPSYLGATPFPVSAVLSGLVNAALVWAAKHWTASPRTAALPLWAWLLAVAVMTFGGPADDTIFGGRGLMGYGVLLLIIFGAIPPGWVLWRRRRHLETLLEASGEQAQQQLAQVSGQVPGHA